MKAIIKINNPDKIELSLTLTMPLEAWKSLKEEMNDRWPSWQFKAIIMDMITKAQTEFVSQDEIVR